LINPFTESNASLIRAYVIFDFEDIREIHSARMVQVRFASGIDQTGKLLMADGVMRFVGSELAFERADVVTITGGEPVEINFWNARLSLGAHWRSGNTEQAESNLEAKVQRRTLETRLVFEYLGNVTSIAERVSANNHRASAVLDRFITRRFYTRPVFAEYFRDPFQNIANRGTVGIGVGYQLADTLKTDWDISGGPAYQYTRFDEVEEGAASGESTIALVGGTRLELEITRTLDFDYDYQFQLVSRAAGLYNHHMTMGFSTDLIRRLDLDISLVWDRIQEPQPEADGTVPEQDDWRLIFGLGFEF
jgi:putative salt-induced outer membrane protein YdiY